MRALAAPVFALVLGVASGSAAQEDDAYRETARAGVAAFNEGDLEEAIARFEEARLLRATPRVDRLLGRAQLAAERPVDAARSFFRALAEEDSDYPLSDAMREEIESELLPEALASIVQLELDGLPEGVALQVDGAPASREEGVLLPPGAHTVEAPGYDASPTSFDAAAGETVTIAFVPAPIADAPVVVPRTRDDDGLLVPGLALLIGGAVVAGTGAALLGVGWEAASRVQAADFYPDVAADDDLARWMTPTGIAALLAGGALLAVGAVLVSLPSGDDTVALHVGPGGVSLAGSFR